MDRLESIVVAVDFSECSASALGQAARMARADNATLHVLHVLESISVMHAKQGAATTEEALRDQVLSETKKRLKNFLPESDRPRNITIDVRVGSPLADVLAKLREVSADLLVLGARGMSGPKRLGTLARDAVRRAPTKVIIVRQRHSSRFTNVVACVDLTDNSWRAVREAVRIAKQDKAKLRLLHVYQAPWKRLHYKSPTTQTSPAFKKQFLDSHRERLEKFLEPFADEISGLDVGCRLFEFHDYSAGIREYIRRNDVDLAILATRGRNLRSMIFGSTTEQVMRKLPCSVLAIKPGDGDWVPDALATATGAATGTATGAATTGAAVTTRAGPTTKRAPRDRG